MVQTKSPKSWTSEPCFELVHCRPLPGGSPDTASRTDVRGQRALMKGRPRLRTAERVKVSRCLSNVQGGQLHLSIAFPGSMKTAGSPHWHPTIQVCLLPERRGIVALVRRKNRKKFLRLAGLETIGNRPRPAVLGTLRPDFSSSRSEIFFLSFSHTVAGAIADPQANLRKTTELFRTATAAESCDDLLTIPVDNPDRWGL
jgi:hypothetical protein